MKAVPIIAALAIVLLFGLLVAYCLSEISTLKQQVVVMNVSNAQHDARLNYLLG